MFVWGGVSGISLALATIVSITTLSYSERIRAEGVSACEYQAAHLIVNLFILCLQNILLLLAAAIVTNTWKYALLLALIKCWIILGGNTFCGTTRAISIFLWKQIS